MNRKEIPPSVVANFPEASQKIAGAFTYVSDCTNLSSGA